MLAPIRRFTPNPDTRAEIAITIIVFLIVVLADFVVGGR